MSGSAHERRADSAPGPCFGRQASAAPRPTASAEAESRTNAEPVQPSVQTPRESAQSYDLLHYLNSTPLRSTLVENNDNPADPTNQRVVNNRNFVLKFLIYSHLFASCAVCGLIVWTVVAFKLRLYEPQQNPSECLIFFWLIRMLLKTCMSAWSIRYQCRRVREPVVIERCRTAYNFGSLFWLFAAVYYIIFRPQENLHSFSCKTCFFLMWITVACYISPVLAYTMLCMVLYPMIFFIVRVREQGSLSPALPKKLMHRIEVERFDRVVERINSGETKPLRLSREASVERRLPRSSSVVVTVRSDEQDKHQRSNTVCLGPSPPTNAVAVVDRLCAICILEIADREKVYAMPCDLRHLFHKDCLTKWFKRSRVCPICRVNVADLLKDAPKPSSGRSI